MSPSDPDALILPVEPVVEDKAAVAPVTAAQDAADAGENSADAPRKRRPRRRKPVAPEAAQDAPATVEEPAEAEAMMPDLQPAPAPLTPVAQAGPIARDHPETRGPIRPRFSAASAPAGSDAARRSRLRDSLRLGRTASPRSRRGIRGAMHRARPGRNPAQVPVVQRSLFFSHGFSLLGRAGGVTGQAPCG